MILSLYKNILNIFFHLSHYSLQRTRRAYFYKRNYEYLCARVTKLTLIYTYTHILKQNGMEDTTGNETALQTNIKGFQ
jgi:hypothetical protein